MFQFASKICRNRLKSVFSALLGLLITAPAMALELIDPGPNGDRFILYSVNDGGTLATGSIDIQVRKGRGK